MPIYEYRCGECGEQFEKLVRMSGGDSDITCPRCGSKKAHKSLSLFGVGAGKGSGSLAATGSSCGSSGST